MIKDELIFKWTNSDSHRGYKILAFIVVALIFTIFIGSVKLKSGSPLKDAGRSASVIQFQPGELGRYWSLRAEEEGPFPGRLIGRGDDSIFDLTGLSEADQKVEWTPYLGVLTPIQASVGTFKEVSEDNKKYLPDRSPNESKLNSELNDSFVSKTIPILIPFDARSKGWMPESLPEYKAKLGENAVPASWRFVLSLRPDGSVDQCLTLNGEAEPSLDSMLDWLKQVRFRAGSSERWLGLRVEFVNRYTYGSKPE